MCYKGMYLLCPLSRLHQRTVKWNTIFLWPEDIVISNNLLLEHVPNNPDSTLSIPPCKAVCLFCSDVCFSRSSIRKKKRFKVILIFQVEQIAGFSNNTWRTWTNCRSGYSYNELICVTGIQPSQTLTRINTMLAHECRTDLFLTSQLTFSVGYAGLHYYPLTRRHPEAAAGRSLVWRHTGCIRLPVSAGS